MRLGILILLTVLVSGVTAQSVRINEIGRKADLPVALQYVELELYNQSKEPYDLKGCRFFLGARSIQIQQDLIIQPKGFEVLTFGRKDGDAPTDLELGIPWQGGMIMLWDASGVVLP